MKIKLENKIYNVYMMFTYINELFTVYYPEKFVLKRNQMNLPDHDIIQYNGYYIIIDDEQYCVTKGYVDKTYSLDDITYESPRQKTINYLKRFFQDYEYTS